MPTRKVIRYSMNTYPICDSPLYRSGRRGFARSQKSRQTIRSYVWTEALSAMVLLPAQKLSSVVWGIIGNNTLINIDAKNVEAKCSVPTKWEFYVGYFHSNFHHLNWFADTMRPFLERDRAFLWRYSKSCTYDQLMADTFACRTIKEIHLLDMEHASIFLLGPSLFRVEGWLGHGGGERRRLRLQKGYLFMSVFKL